MKKKKKKNKRRCAASYNFMFTYFVKNLSLGILKKDLFIYFVQIHFVVDIIEVYLQ